jgi:palmitoyltransferase ZDHHC13/17
LNAKTKDDGFTALHFASFRGNLDLIKLLIKYGADMYARNNYGIDMMHVSAQGDMPISMYYYRHKGLDVRSRDKRMSTPLHWAIYSKSEAAVSYIIAWNKELNDQDIEGYTPLHLAVKSVDQLDSVRPVRILLMRGANRDIKDYRGRRPIDLVEQINNAELR